MGVRLSSFPRPDDGMVDVLDLGSRFWEFKSPSGYVGRYSSMVERSIVDREIWVQFPIAAPRGNGRADKGVGL